MYSGEDANLQMDKKSGAAVEEEEIYSKEEDGDDFSFSSDEVIWLNWHIFFVYYNSFG